MRGLYFAIWVILIGYTFLLAPGVGFINIDLIKDIIIFKGVDPLVISLFYLFGIWPFVFGGLLFKNCNSDIPAWPFVLLMFVFGVFSLLPYYFLKDQHTDKLTKPQNWFRLNNKYLYYGLMIIVLFLYTYGIVLGDFRSFYSLATYSWFVHIMSIDFIMLTFLSIIELYKKNKKYATLGFIPIIGPLYYLIKENKSL